MSFSTQGIELKTRNEWLRQATELLSSMRFAISLLTVIAIASVIGTVHPHSTSDLESDQAP